MSLLNTHTRSLPCHQSHKTLDIITRIVKKEKQIPQNAHQPTPSNNWPFTNVNCDYQRKSSLAYIWLYTPESFLFYKGPKKKNKQPTYNTIIDLLNQYNCSSHRLETTNTEPNFDENNPQSPTKAKTMPL